MNIEIQVTGLITNCLWNIKFLTNIQSATGELEWQKSDKNDNVGKQ
jgi:hypothetical protein